MSKSLFWNLVLFSLVCSSCGVWVAQRYDYPKDGAIEVVRFGLERGGRYEMDVSFRFLVKVPNSLLNQVSVRIYGLLLTSFDREVLKMSHLTLRNVVCAYSCRSTFPCVIVASQEPYLASTRVYWFGRTNVFRRSDEGGDERW